MLGLGGYLHSWRVVAISQVLSFGTLMATYAVWDVVLQDGANDFVPFISDVGDADPDYPWVYWMFAWFYTVMSVFNAMGIWMIYAHIRVVFLSLLPEEEGERRRGLTSGILVEDDYLEFGDAEYERKVREDDICCCCCGCCGDCCGLRQSCLTMRVWAGIGVIPLLVGFMAMAAMGLTAHVCTSCSNTVHLFFAGSYFFCSIFSIASFSLLLGIAYYLRAKAKDSSSRSAYAPLLAWMVTGGLTSVLAVTVAIVFGFVLLTDLDNAWKAFFEWTTVTAIHLAFFTFAIPMATFGKTRLVVIIDDYYHVVKVEEKLTNDEWTY